MEAEHQIAVLLLSFLRIKIGIVCLHYRVNIELNLERF